MRRPTATRPLSLVALVAVATVVLGPAAWAQGPTKPVSFAREVAPLLVSKCGGCHVAGRKGGFQMASYDALMRSMMVQRGVADASRLVEVILSGDMPRGGGKVAPAELDVLRRWINSGAACDAPDPTIPLEALARGAVAAAAMPTAPVVRPTLRPGDVSFAADIAPLLLDQCGNCHGETDPEGNLRMTSFQRLVRGGRTGAAITAGNGKSSLLVQKLRGTAADGARMPLGRDPLPAEVISAIEKWIDQGAVLDMLGPDDPLEVVAAAGRARSLGDAELLKIRSAAAGPIWRQAIPDEPPVVAARRRISVLGNLPAERLVTVADQAERLEEKVRDLLVEGDGPLLKGGLVVYIFGKSYDYSAFWQQVVGRERPRGVAAHAAVTGDVVYAAVLASSSTAPSSKGGDDFELLVAEQIAAAALAGRGAPEWFAQGAGRSLAARIVPKAPLAKEWKRDVGSAVMQIGSPADFVGWLGEPAALAHAAGGFVSSVAPPARLAKVVAAIDAGKPFTEAFATVFKAQPEQLYAAWAAKQKPGKR